jgi:hypothetical protein
MKAVWSLCLTFLLLVSGCAKAPPTLAPDAVATWQAHEAVLIVANVQRAAIGLNGIQKCDADTPPVCASLVSDHNTKIVGTATSSAIRTIRQYPNGWKATATEALDSIAKHLDAAGLEKIAAYLNAARLLLGAIS